MTNKGYCEEETEKDTERLLTWFIEFKKLGREMKQRDYTVANIFIAHAERIDNLERRLVLLEDRVYKDTGKSPCE